MICPKCKAVLGDTAKFCTKCGFKIMSNPQPMVTPMQSSPIQHQVFPSMQQPMQQPSQGSGFCTSCGAKLNPNVKFCTKCGATAGAPAATSIPKPASMPAFVHPTPQAVAPSLLRMKNNEKIEIEGSEFLIGKKQEMVNYCISDNPAVSRVHAKIIQRNGQYFIMDMGSTNHTYVNGIKVSANIETPIRNNSKIRISNEEFIFHA